MNVNTYVEDLFKGYEDSPALQDFKEEICSNLHERIQDLGRQGLSADDAFTKAIAELGDITSIADEISRNKRNEIIERMYFQHKTKIDTKHAIGYAFAGGLALFGILIALITYYSTGEIFKGISSLLPFVLVSGISFVYLGLTQETARNLPMSSKRAALYALSAGLVLLGLTITASSYFMKGMEMHAVLGSLIPFVIPGICLLAFLLLTEKSRNKPWVIKEQEQYMELYAKKYSDPRRAEQRGLLSGALWIFAISIFIVLAFTIGLKYAWIVFLFAIAAEVLIEFWMVRKAL